MASSSSSERRPAKLVRHNSSFLGTIKNLVTAPLTWFGNQDDEFTSGKRRRSLQQAPTEPMLSTDEETRRSKRMRLHSPPQPARRTSVIPRASSAVLPSRVHRSTLSPMRHLSISRTMSIDPPTRENSFNFVDDMDVSMDTIRDPSPLSPKPSFRMRSSLTPQPQLKSRHISEPPPLNVLISSHPVFLHPPSVSHDPSPAPTLGSLVESVRSTRSPLRQQHAALLLVSDKNLTNNEHDNAPAERALHQLDVYKTPLLPTRMRASNLPASITATTTPDMFKSRRPSHLILMQDDKDRLGRKTGKSPVVNETKPYAGEGGMKKLLARRKLEEDLDHENDQKDNADHKDKDGQNDQADLMAKETDSMDDNTSQYNLRPLPAVSLSGNKSGSDWFATASSSSASTSGSSLRVGRVKTSRNHIQRPSRARFSAVYEDDGDDNIEDDGNRRGEREELEEAARRAPVFSIPEGFSFANDASAPPIKPVDLENAKEPPIPVLPFSFAKSTTIPAPVSAQHSFFGAVQTDGTTNPRTQGNAPSEPSAPVVPSVPISESKSTPAPFTFPSSAPASSGNGGIPNFFASSQFLAKNAPAPPVLPPVLNFTASPTVPSAPARPVKDAENPFWDGEKESKRSEDKSAQNILPALEKTVTGTPSSFTPVLLYSASVADVKPAAVLPFSFNKPTETKPEASNFGSTTVEPKQPFSFQAPSKPVSSDDAPSKSSSGENVPSPILPSFLGEAPLLLGKPANTTSAFGQVVPPQSSPSPLPFTFGSQSSSKTEPKATFSNSDGTPDVTSTHSSAIEAPKPSFGGISGGKTFSFDQAPARSTEQDATKLAPFSFGTSSPAPVVEPKPVTEPSPIFSFGQPSGTTIAPPPISFSFSGGGSTSADISTRQPFMFGQHNVAAPTERPVTPPRNPDNEFRMEESPTREIQQSNGTNKPALTLGSGFLFNSSASTGPSLFGGGSQNTTSPLPTTSPFSFGGSSPSNPFTSKDKVDEPKAFGGFGQTSTTPSTSSNPFASQDKTDEPKPFGTFGKTSAVPSTSTGFTFGQPAKVTEEAQRPSTTGSFSFNTTPTSATTSSPFSFGTPQNANPFGQATSGSAPSSPSTFNQPSPFAFGAPASSTNAPFGFGSQPASPAGGANLSLPQPASSGGFAFGQQAQQPSSPFGAPIPLAPSTSSGGSLFTIGAAPTPATPAGGSRQIRKLPTRRGGVKR
ncbi:hypothetical protein BYT27DRAFT_7260065 [Phlegmacium glaucopus]|nr:hypothetical protein BYT27DRAFT_7260065 [Phlegmacium glaucopus]